MEITKREILASVTIIAVMMILGIVIAGRIDAHQVQKNSEYYSALQITDAEQFQYGMDTSVGNAFVYGTLEAADPVTYPEIGGEYLYVEKVEEHYTMHTRTVTTTDSKLLKQYFKEHAGDETATFPGFFNFIKECMEDDGFFKLSGLDKMIENQAKAMAEEAPEETAKSGSEKTKQTKEKSTSAK